MRLSLAVAVGLLTASSAWAGPLDAPASLFPVRPANRGTIQWLSDPATSPPVARIRLVIPASLELEPDPQPLHAAAIEHSDAYLLRAKIHKYASVATLPLFAAEVALGQSLYNSTRGEGDARRGLHAAVGAGIVGLFGVNTVTGAWNMFGEEGRKDKTGRTLRLVHGLLMMAADAGFVATEASAPGGGDERRAGSVGGDRARHRNLAIASVGIGTVGYLMMLIHPH